MFSVIIPLYNKESTIKEAIESVLKQEFTEFELIIVNDGSTDDSYNIASSFKDSRIQLFGQQNKGVSSARNYGISKSKFNFIAFLDGDDLWETNFLKEMYYCITAFPDAVLYGAGHDLLCTGKNTLVKYPIPVNFKNYVKDYFSIAYKSILYSSSSVVIQKNLCALPLYNENVNLGEDLLVWFKLALTGKVFFINKTLAHYRHFKSGQTKHRKFNLKQTHLPYLKNLSEFKKDNVLFSRFISWHCAKNARKYYFSDERKEVICDVFPAIDFSLLSIYWYLTYKMPYFFSRMVYNFLRYLR